jgi:ADP-ribosylglycohydrolase
MDLFKGSIYGSILGDVLGAPYEFVKSVSLSEYTGIIKHKPIRYYRFTDTYKYSALGQFTDDTEMKLALMHSIVTSNGYNRDNAILSYLDWANSGCCFMGNTTRELLKGVTTLRGYNGRMGKYMHNHNIDEYSQSNGCLMRCAPIAILDVDDVSKMDCTITNPSDVCVEVCTIYNKILKSLIKGEEISLENVSENECIVNAIELGYNGNLKGICGKSKGWVCHAFRCAIAAITHYSDETFSNTIDAIIRAGGDTDTNAAIAGALKGAQLGWVQMCKEENVIRNIGIINRCKCEDGDMPRPEKYTIKCVDGLIEAFDKFL